MNKKNIVLLSAIFCFIVFCFTSGFSNGLNLNSVGSKAVAMGGAFVGLADDYSAVFWNPAGISQMEDTTIAFFGTDIMPTIDYSYNAYGMQLVDAKTESKGYISGAVGFFKPISDKMVIGVLGYVPSGIGAKWDGADFANIAGGIYEWESQLSIITVSPVVAYKINDKLSLGATVNINYGMLSLKRPGLGQYEEDLNGTALNFTLGALYKPSDKLSIGLSLKTPFDAKLSGDATMNGASLLGLPTTDNAEREATWPMWVAAGVAFKPMDKLTITADLQYTNWGELTSIPIEFENVFWKAAFEADADLELFWDDAIQYRFGAEYMISDKMALRGGYYYDPAPAPDSTLNILLPQFTYNWVTLGLGFMTEKLNIDVAVEYGMGSEREVTMQEVNPNAGMPGTHKGNILVPNIAITYRF